MRRIISVFMLCLFITTVVKAEDGVDDGDYVEVNKGEQAPFDGYLFDHGGIAALIAKHNSEKEQISLTKDTEFKKLKLDLETELKIKQTEIDVNKKLSDDIIKINKEELQLTKSKLERVSWLAPTLFVGGIITGTVLAVSILKIAVGITK
jgi:hypothetical protein